MNPQDDGVTHINIYSKGQTSLGRSLSNFANYPLVIGGIKYASIEAYWYAMSLPVGIDLEDLPTLHGYAAKSKGKYLLGLNGTGDRPQEEFNTLIKLAMRRKLLSYPALMQEFKVSTLPFAHYYVFGDGNAKDAGYEWIVKEWEKMRKIAKEKNL